MRDAANDRALRDQPIRTGCQERSDAKMLRRLCRFPREQAAMARIDSKPAGCLASSSLSRRRAAPARCIPPGRLPVSLMSEEKGVTIEFNGGAIPCVVRNMSNFGAMLDVANAEHL